MSVKRLLCVEDDADTRALLKIMLGYSDFEAVTTSDAASALRLMQGERFSLYILDGGLRSANGLSLCEQIRASDADTPIIIFSGSAFPSDIRAGMLAGANAYLVKPEFDKLVPIIRGLLRDFRGEAEAKESH